MSTVVIYLIRKIIIIIIKCNVNQNFLQPDLFKIFLKNILYLHNNNGRIFELKNSNQILVSLMYTELIF